MPSTAIRRFTDNPDSRALDVTFVTGRRYRYFAVPGEVAWDFREALSKGRFFNPSLAPSPSPVAPAEAGA